MLFPLDGPALQNALSITTTVVVEAKIGASAFKERKAVTIQPKNGDLYIYFGDDTTTPTNTDLTNKGMLIYSGAKETYEASASQRIFLMAVSATTTVIVVERA